MEGAVRSGYLAAQGILSVLDRPTRLVRPGLKTGLLAGWLFGKGDDRTARRSSDAACRLDYPGAKPRTRRQLDEPVAPTIVGGVRTG